MPSIGMGEVSENGETIHCDCPDLPSMQRIATRLAECLQGADSVLYLQGDLGAGKTTIIRFFLRSLGYSGRVKSPTYGLMESYEIGAARYVHMDLYRLGDGEELEYLGLRDLCQPGTSFLIEWPERFTGMIPPPDLELNIDFSGDGRRLGLKAVTALGRNALRRIGKMTID